MLKDKPFGGKAAEGKYWFCEKRTGKRSVGQLVISTAEALALLRAGGELRVITGPHASRLEAENSADDCWAEPGG